MKITVYLSDGPNHVNLDVSKTFGGNGSDLVGIARHWYYALLIIMWLGFAADIFKLIGWLARVA